MVVPVPPWTTVPLPEIKPAKVELSERLNVSVALSVTLPVIAPVTPPLPSCSVPALIVVPPV